MAPASLVTNLKDMRSFKLDILPPLEIEVSRSSFQKIMSMANVGTTTRLIQDISSSTKLISHLDMEVLLSLHSKTVTMTADTRERPRRTGARKNTKPR
jgi:hypothetical protein